MERRNPKRDEIIDMSPEAIDRRLRELAELYRFWCDLEEAKRRGDLKLPEQHSGPTNS